MTNKAKTIRAIHSTYGTTYEGQIRISISFRDNGEMIIRGYYPDSNGPDCILRTHDIKAARNHWKAITPKKLQLTNTVEQNWDSVNQKWKMT